MGAREDGSIHLEELYKMMYEVSVYNMHATCMSLCMCMCVSVRLVSLATWGG